MPPPVALSHFVLWLPPLISSHSFVYYFLYALIPRVSLLSSVNVCVCFPPGVASLSLCGLVKRRSVYLAWRVVSWRGSPALLWRCGSSKLYRWLWFGFYAEFQDHYHLHAVGFHFLFLCPHLPLFAPLHCVRFRHCGVTNQVFSTVDLLVTVKTDAISSTHLLSGHTSSMVLYLQYKIASFVYYSRQFPAKSHMRHHYRLYPEGPVDGANYEPGLTYVYYGVLPGPDRYTSFSALTQWTSQNSSWVQLSDMVMDSCSSMCCF